jgi:hypothetical protein
MVLVVENRGESTVEVTVDKLSKRLDKPTGLIYSGSYEFETYSGEGSRLAILPDSGFMCLKPDRCYRFDLKDDQPGMQNEFIAYVDSNTFETQMVGFTSVDGSEVIYCTSGPKSLFSSENAGMACQDEEFLSDSEVTCGQYVKPALSKFRRSRCMKQPDEDSEMRVYDWCPKTCGRYGIGPCSVLEGRKRRNGLEGRAFRKNNNNNNNNNNTNNVTKMTPRMKRRDQKKKRLYLDNKKKVQIRKRRNQKKNRLSSEKTILL